MPKSSVVDTRNQLGQDIETGDVLLSNAEFWGLLEHQTLIDGKLLSRVRERGRGFLIALRKIDRTARVQCGLCFLESL